MGISWVNIQLNQVVSRTPCYLYQVIITSDGGGPAEAEFYDGTNDNEDLICDFKTLSGGSSGFHLNGYLETRKGLYVKNIKHVKNVLVIYSTRKE